MNDAFIVTYSEDYEKSADVLNEDVLMWSLGHEIQVLDFVPKRYHGFGFFPN